MIIDGDDIHGDGVNIAARLEGIAAPGGICLSRAAHDQVEGNGWRRRFRDAGDQELKNIARPVRVYAIDPSAAAPQPQRHQPAPSGSPAPPRLSIVVLPFANIGGDPEQDYFVDGVTESLTTDISRLVSAPLSSPATPPSLTRASPRCDEDRPRTQHPLCARRQRAARRPSVCASMSS